MEEEIRTLYETLESVADDGPVEPANQAPPPALAVAPAASPFAAAPASPFAAGPASPFAAAPSFATAPRPMQPMQPMLSDSLGEDLDVEPTRSKAPVFAVAAVFIAGLGAGGWFLANRPAEAATTPAAAGDPTVIQAGAIPDDTQEPEVAEGADASRTQGTVIKESRRPAPRSSGRTRHRSARKAPAKPKADSREIELSGKSRDPLAGLN